jgi:hypothetical protein
MKLKQFIRHSAAAALLCLVSTGAMAQQPSPSAIATAKELIELKGAVVMLDALIPGIVETAKNTFLPTHPQLSKELNEVAALLRS